jgi:hypothetical protein
MHPLAESAPPRQTLAPTADGDGIKEAHAAALVGCAGEQKNRKKTRGHHLGSRGFCGKEDRQQKPVQVGGTGFEGPTESPGKSMAGYEVSAPVSAADPGVALIAAAWPKLSPETRRAILERVKREIHGAGGWLDAD